MKETEEAQKLRKLTDEELMHATGGSNPFNISLPTYGCRKNETAIGAGISISELPFT